MTVPDPVPLPLDHLLRFGDGGHPALVLRDREFNYRELEAAVARLAAALAGLGLDAGARVATWLPKTVEACMMPLAAARAGLVHIPVNPQLKRAQVAHILADSGAGLLLSQGSRLETLEAGDIPENCLVWRDADAHAAWQSGDGLPPSMHDPDALAAILYTSGSTGAPKGVMLSHANLWLGAVSVAHYLKLAPEDRTLCVLPLSFDYGQNQLFSTWRAGGAAIPLDYLLARDVIRAVERHAPTTLAGVPPFWVQLLEADWPGAAAGRLRRITNSGGALTPELVGKLRKLFAQADIYPMYGLTEAFRSTYLDPALVDVHPASMGKAIPFAEILVIGADGRIAGNDQPGELVHCGPLVAQGYWHDPERTAQRFRPAPAQSAYGGKAVWSGDTVRRDREGLLYFVGRNDEQIKVSGNRISPNEIEAAAIASGAVSEAVALGVPDPRTGQAIVLVARGDGARDEERLVAHFRRELPGFMVPSKIVWRPDLPRNPNGKLDRTAIRAEIAA